MTVPARLATALADRYAIERELGAGGMATVYLAEDLKHHRKVAVKVLRPELAAILGAERFLKEIEVTANLQHPHILPLHDSGEARVPPLHGVERGTGGEAFLYYVMPYVEGESLRDKLNREKQLGVEEAIRIAEQVASALDYAHRHDVIHRDIKPENILLHDDQALVADFGIALAANTVAGSRLTETGFSLGTPEYMSPEQSAGETDLDGRTDMYSLACVLYEMLTAEPPYTGPNAQAVMAKRLATPVPSARTVRDTVPPAIDAALRKAMAKVPADRFETTSDFLTAATTTAVSAGAPRRWQAGALSGLVVVGLILGGVWWTGRSNDNPAARAVSPNRVAVFPATVTGGDSDVLGDGFARLLNMALDGTGDLRGVDPNSLLRVLDREHRGPLDAMSARPIAELMGAGLFALTDVVAVGNELTVRSSLYDASTGLEPVVTADLEGSEESLLNLVRTVAVEFMRGHPIGEGVRMQEIDGLQSTNYDALKAYLEGEAAMRRFGYAQAEEAFMRATAADSTFAMAWYRAAVAHGFLPGVGEYEYIDNARQYVANLSRRDSLIVAGLWHFLLGDPDEFERITLDLMGGYPDHIEALWMRGAWLEFLSWRRGRPGYLDVASITERALKLDPGHRELIWRLTLVRANQGRFREADSLATEWITRGDHRGWNPIMGAAWKLAGTPPDARPDSALMVRMAEESDGALLGVVMFVAAGEFGNVPVASELARLLTDPERRPERTRASGYLWLGLLEADFGRWESAFENFDRAEALSPAWGLVFRALITATRSLDSGRTELENLKSRLLAWDGVLPAGENGLPGNTFGVPSSVQPILRSYLLGLISGRLGDVEDALRYADQVRGGEATPDRGLRGVLDRVTSATVVHDLAQEVEALALWADGNADGALDALQQAELKVVWEDLLWSHMFYTRPYGRLLRAELLRELGRDREASEWYASLGPRTPRHYMAPIHLRRGELYERLNEPDSAAQQYARLLELWQNADPELQPLVSMARERLNILVGEGIPEQAR